MQLRNTALLATAVILASACGLCKAIAGPADRLNSDPGPQMAIQSSDIRGIVLRSDGETPISSMPVKLWDAKKEKITYETRTDGDGLFQIPRLGEGRFFVIIGEMRIDLQMFRNAGIHQQRHDVVVVLPRKIAIGAAMPIPPLVILPVVPPSEPRVISP